MPSPEWLSRHLEHIRRHFDGIADSYPRYKRRNPYYHRRLLRWCRSRVPEARAVLDAGCGRGEILDAVRPSYGVGVDLSEAMVRHARAAFPAHRFIAAPIQEVRFERQFDAALCINTLEYAGDLGSVLAALQDCLRDNGRLVIATANPMWSAAFRWASRLGLRIPDCRRLFVTNKDLVNLLGLYGFEVVDELMDMVLPKGVPLVSDLLNGCVSRLPVLRWLSSTQLIVARKLPGARRDYSVSVVIPCHNERDNMDRCVGEIPRFGTRTELIIVDDGSSDGTAEAVRPERNPEVDVRVIRYTPNQGKGAAVRRGFQAATGDIVMIVDADLTTHPEDLAILYEAFASGRAEFVNCTRMVYPMDEGAMKVANYLGNKAFTILVSLIMERRVSDTLCGTKAMFRDDFPYLEMGRDPWGDYDFLFGAAQMRLAIREVPIHYRERRAGHSKMRALRHTVNLLRMCFHGFWQVKTYRPLERRQHADRQHPGPERKPA